MSRAMDELMDMAVYDERLRIALRLLIGGQCTQELIAEATLLSLDTIKQLDKMKNTPDEAIKMISALVKKTEDTLSALDELAHLIGADEASAEMLSKGLAQAKNGQGLPVREAFARICKQIK